MYRPANKKQTGGDFTNVLPGGVKVHVSQSTMDLIAQMANISSFAQMSSFINFYSLTPVQVSQLLDSIATAIAQEDGEIGNNISSINALNKMINEPTVGLQAIYDSTVNSYSTTVFDYYSTVNSVSTIGNLISSYDVSISALVLREALEASTVSTLDSNYNDLMYEVQQDIDTLASQINMYSGLSMNYEEYVTKYRTNYQKYTEKKEALETNFISLGTAYNRYVQTLSSNDLSTLKYLSTTYLENISTTEVLSSIVGDSLKKKMILQPYVQSTIDSICTLAAFSTTYSSPDLDAYYSTIQAHTLSTMKSYTDQQGIIQSTLVAYETKYEISRSVAQSEYNVLSQKIDRFYTKATTNITNQLLSYQYQVQEWSAFIGYLTAQLLIQKNIVALQINDTSLFNRGDSITLSNNNLLKTTIQSIVNVFNVLDLSFNNVIKICVDEMVERENYIDAIKNATALEGIVLMNISTYTDVYQEYSEYKEDATQAKTNINVMQDQRLREMSEIMHAIVPQLAIVQDLVLGGKLQFSFTIPEDVSTDSTPFGIDPTLYQILPELGATT